MRTRQRFPDGCRAAVIRQPVRQAINALKFHQAGA